MTDILIIGAGLSGLFAAQIAADRNAEVTLVAKGRGGLALSHGCIDIWAHASPSRALHRLHKQHPYKLAGKDALDAALSSFMTITSEADYPFVGTLSKNLSLPSGSGMLHQTAYAPHTLAQSQLKTGEPFALAGIQALRDFYPHFSAANLARQGLNIEKVVELPLPQMLPKRDLYSTDLAERFENPSWSEQVARAWRPLVRGVHRLGLPAVIGWRHSTQAFEQLQAQLGMQLFEIPTLPPSLPGLRLESLLRGRAERLGVRFIEGSTAIGRVNGTSGGKRVSGVVLQTVGGSRELTADLVILATGGVLHGGLVSLQNGTFQEAIFDLPVKFDEGRETWTASSPMETQPFSTFGLAVNERMQPIGTNGEALFENLFVAGGILAGADRSFEGSRQGIDLATAYRAVESAIE